MKKDNEKKFDELMKNILSQDDNTPNDFAWEKMDIEIPKKKSKRRFFLILFGFGIALLVFTLVNLNNIFPSLNDSNIEAALDNPTISNKTETEHPIEEQEGSKELNQGVITPSKEPKDTNTPVENKPPASNSREISQNKIAAANKQLQTKSPSNTLTQSTSSNATKSINAFPTEPTSKIVTDIEAPGIKATKENSEDSYLNPFESSGINALPNPLPNISQTSIAFDELKKLRLKIIFLSRQQYEINKSNLATDFRAEDESQLPEDHTNSNQSDFAINIMTGINTNQFKFEPNSGLLGKVEQRTGLSLAVGLEKKIRPKIHILLGLNYQEIHTGFRHSTTEVENNYFSSVQTTTNTRYYKNNFSKVIGINLGLGSTFLVRKNIEMQANLSISPYYQLSISGLSFENEMLVDLDDSVLDDRLYFNLSPSLDFKYKLNNHFYLKTSYIFNIEMRQGAVLHNGVTAKNNQQLLFGVSYAF